MDKSIETYIEQIIRSLNCDEEEKNDLKDEIKDHLYLLKNEFLEEGLTDEESTRKALKSFGEQKQLIEGYQASLSPFYSLYRVSLWILFTIYVLLISYYLLFKRLISRIIDYAFLGETYNQYFFYPEGSTGFFNLKVWQENSNIVPFQNTLNYLKGSDIYNLEVIINNTLGNILLFLPLGFLLPILFKKCNTTSKVFIVSLIISFTYEALQFTLQIGQFDIDDVILNVIGGILGFTVLKSIYVIRKLIKKNNLQKTTT